MKRTRVRQFVERLTGWRQLLFWCQFPISDPRVWEYPTHLLRLCQLLTGVEPMEKKR
jgi:hypothetical protein